MGNRLGGGMSRLQIFLLFFSQENGDRGSQRKSKGGRKHFASDQSIEVREPDCCKVKYRPR